MKSQEQFDQEARDVIEQHGWMDLGVFPTEDDPGVPFNYTVGLVELSHPDLIVLGLNNNQAHGILCSAVKLIEKGTMFQADHYAEQVLTGFPVAFIEVVDYLGDYPMSMTKRLYGHVQALQMVWPDMKGQFPWQPNFDAEYREHQPLLGPWRGSV